MRVDKTQHSYYCGLNRNARSLFVNVLDDTGRPLELIGTASVVTLACHCREMRCRLKNHTGAAE